MVFCPSFVVAILAGVVLADNDWSKPCFSGVCQYDLPASAGSASGTLKIWGAESAIADITTAAGWEILGCSPDTLQQDIRLVCKEGSEEACVRLYSGDGAEGKVVRLPENCGKGPFAVITKAWVPQDQTLPAGASLARRDGSKPEVKALSLAVDFKGAASKRKSGDVVNFAIQAANVPGAQGAVDDAANARRRRSAKMVDRGLIDFAKNAVKKISSLNDFDVNNNKNLTLPFDVNKPFTLIDEKKDCGAVQASLKIDVDTKAHAVATIGVAAKGTLVPPKIDDFSIITNFNADIDGTVHVLAGVTGTIDSGKIKLLEVPIGGLEFPGILTVGPSFQINAQAKAILDLNVGLDVGIKYKVASAEVTFPPNKGDKTSGKFDIGDTPLKLTATPDAKATGTLEAHLIPSLNLGLNALGDLVDAEVFVELDASASLKLSLEASKQLGADVPAKKVRRGEMLSGRYWNRPSSSAAVTKKVVATPAVHKAMGSVSRVMVHKSSMATKAVSVSPHKMIHETSSSKAATEECGPATKTVTVTAAEGKATSTTSAGRSVETGQLKDGKAAGNDEKPKVETENKASFQGCVEIDAGLDVNAGATADFFNFFNKDTKVSLFSKKFELFKKCFGNNTAKRSIVSRSLLPSESVFERGVLDLVCPAAQAPAQAVTDGIISAANIKAL